MKQVLAGAVMAVSLLVSGMALAEPKTVTLAVENMYCPSCPYIVKKSLTSVKGVTAVVVSLEQETAVVTYDDEQATIDQLTEATFDRGYPSTLVQN